MVIEDHDRSVLVYVNIFPLLTAPFFLHLIFKILKDFSNLGPENSGTEKSTLVERFSPEQIMSCMASGGSALHAESTSIKADPEYSWRRLPWCSFRVAYMCIPVAPCVLRRSAPSKHTIDNDSWPLVNCWINVLTPPCNHMEWPWPRYRCRFAIASAIFLLMLLVTGVIIDDDQDGSPRGSRMDNVAT